MSVIAADNITSIKGVKIQVQNNFTSGLLHENIGDISHNDYTLTPSDGTYCLEQDLRTSTPSPDGNTSPNTAKVTINNCQSNNSNQLFNYANEMLTSAAGYCLTRQESMISISESTGETGLSCRNITTGESHIQFTFKQNLKSDIALQACNSSDKNQKWQLQFTGDAYQIKSSGECLTFTGEEQIELDLSSGTWECGSGRFYPNGYLTKLGIQSFELFVGTAESCASNDSYLKYGDMKIMVIEKTLPIIIPM